MNDKQLTEIKEIFLKQLPIYKKLVYEVERILKDKLKSENLKTAYVLYRVKDIDSFSEKIHRKGYDNPFE